MKLTQIASLKQEKRLAPAHPQTQDDYDRIDDINAALNKDITKQPTSKQPSRRALKDVMEQTSSDPVIAFDQANVRVVEALTLLKQFTLDFQRKFQQTPRDWGYPGTMASVAAKLEEIVDSVTRTD